MFKENSGVLAVLVVVAIFVGASCSLAPQNTSSHVVIGESFASGTDAAQELQLAINRSQTVGCKAESIGGYGAGGEGLVIGLAALVTCPDDIDLIPTGFPFDSNGNAIPVDPAAVVPPAIP